MAVLSGAVRTRERSNSARARGLELVRATGLTGMVRRASDHAAGGLGTERLLPVAAELRGLLPGGGLRRGATVAVDKDATSLLLALMAAASQAGSWCAVVGVPTLSAAAAAEAGIALDRLALVPNPGPGWTGVVGALLDGLDIVVVAVPGPIAPTVSGRLTARARQRGSVLVSYGDWRGADVTLDVVSSVWHGLGAGRGRLQCRELTVVVHGRGAVAVPRRARVWLPRPTGLYAQLHPHLELAAETAAELAAETAAEPVPERPRLAVVERAG